MQAQYASGLIDNGWIVFAHVERAGSWNASAGGGYNVEHFRDFNNAGPDICFGFEGAPGHQVNDLRGLGNVQFGGTYGGVGWYTAKVGGLWDALLGEGRRWFNFASSDYHKHWTNCEGGCGDDFYPGEYQKDWLFAKDADRDGTYSLDEIADALRSGNSFFVQGDLVDGLMNNAGAAPVVDHIDLIAGEFGEKIAKELAPGVPNPEYSNPTNPTTQVIASFDAKDFRNEGHGWRSVRYVYKDLKKNTYFRLRGTNLPCGTPNEMGPATKLPSRDFCSPLADALLYPNTAEKAFADLWFYSNPIFVEVK
jgi:hypothetical protein